MSNTFVVSCIQNCASAEVEPNIKDTTQWVRAAHSAGADLVCLPEYFSCLEVGDQRILAKAFPEETHPALPHFSALAKALAVWILMGSLAIKVGPDKVNNRAYMIDASGHVVARYNKLHLFDVDLRSGESYRESATVRPGEEAVLAPTPWGFLGLSICYDLRFAYLYRALAQAGAKFLSVPAAFTRTTGEAHWHVLLRARAIETGCYVFAPCQCGIHAGGRQTYGHSLIVDPWGCILADGGEEPGFILAEIDPAKVDEARRRIPALRHDRTFSGPGPVTLERTTGSA
jgi:Predicted amidohydrolase